MTTTEFPPPPPQASDWRAPVAAGPVAAPKKKLRKFTWVILAFNALMLIWIIGGTMSAANSADCASEMYQDACEAGTAVGAGIAIFGLLFLTMMVDAILAVIWFVTRKNHQH